MFFNEDDWPVVTPFEYGGDHLAEAGYEESDIVGDYEYINHGNATNGNVINYQKITLNADHTISGDVTGKWEQASGSAAATITIGNQRYTGYFIAAENEKGTDVMSFTAVGSNNQTIWGAKTSNYSGTPRAGSADYTNANADLVMAPDTVSDDQSKALTLSGTNFLSGLTYYIVNQNSGLSLDLPEGKLDAGTNVQQWDFNKSWAQQWRLVAVDKDYFRIVSLGDESKCIAVAENTANDGVNVELQTYTGAANQLFKLKEYNGYYGIVSKCSGDKGALDVFEWSKENGGNINQYAFNNYACQLWSITPIRPAVTSGYYTIKNLNSALYVSDNSGNAVQSDTQTWYITKQADGNYTVQDANGKALTVENGASEDGANIIVTDFKGDDSQKFSIRCNKDGTYSLLTLASGNARCVDVYEISKDNGANINQWEFWGGDGQKFILEPTIEAKPVETTTTTTTTTTPTTTTTTTTTEETTTTTQPETTTTTATEEAVKKLLGDADESGDVSVSDIVAVLQYSANKEKYPLGDKGIINADVDGNGVISANDAFLIQQFDAGVIDKFPAEQS